MSATTGCKTHLDDIAQLVEPVHGESSGPIEVAAGVHDVYERGAAIGNYLVKIVCNEAGGATDGTAGWQQDPTEAGFELDVEAGEEWLCTVTNVEIPEACQSLGLTNLILGTDGRDLLTGTDANDLIFGFGGNDYLYGSRGGTDCLVGGEGDDRLRGDNEDVLIDGNGRDVSSTPGGTNVDERSDGGSIGGGPGDNDGGSTSSRDDDGDTRRTRRR